MKKIIINADDFGITPLVSEGIVYGHKNGQLSSTTVLSNCLNDHTVKLIQETRSLGFGVHLNLTLGAPLTNNKTLSENGRFLRNKDRDFDLNEVENELKAQIDLFIEKTGQLPSHLDAHHGVSENEKIAHLFQKFAKELNIPLRRHNEFKFVSGFYNDKTTVEHLIQLIENEKDEKLEIMCHPGFVNQEIISKSSYNWQRAKELVTLCDTELKNYFEKKEIELVSYREG